MALAVEPVSIEPMLASDLDAVHRIDKRCFPTPWLPGAYLTELSNRSACYLVARIGPSVVGYAGQWIVSEEAHVTTLAVDPDQRGRKIGERLVLALMEEAVLRGATHSTLEVREGNRAAQGLYRKFGFRDAAIRKSYYTDNGENAIVMWAEEIHSPVYREKLRQLRQQIHATALTS